MLSDFLAQRIKAHLPFELTADQNKVVEQLAVFLSPHSTAELFLLKGYAGTGKTSIIGALVKAFAELKQKVVLLAPTGRAAKVISLYAGQTAQTIHKKIYRQRSAANPVFMIDQNLHKHTLFVVDEASMIANLPAEGSNFGSGFLLDDLIHYVYGSEGCRLLLMGDVAQLPPVGQAISPALERSKLESYGFRVIEYLMTQVVRQASESGILHNATLLRNRLNEGDTHTFPAFETEGFPDVTKISGEDLIETLNRTYDEDRMENTMVVTRTNKRANIYSQGIRNRILYREDELASGDLLLVTRNNYFWGEGEERIDFIANGDIAEIVRVRRHRTIYDFRFVELVLRFADYDTDLDVIAWLDTLQAETPADVTALNQELYRRVSEDYAHIGNRRERIMAMRKNPYYNALQVKFAYAVTCHKAQGGQWTNVFIDQGYITEEMLGTEYYRWLYTAFTRATKRVFLVNLK